MCYVTFQKRILTLLYFFQALDFIDENKSDFGIRKAKRLPVSGAFHTSLMAPAVDVMKQAVSQAAIHNPRIPVHSNVGGSAIYRRAGDLRRWLPKQVTAQVKWEQSMCAMFNEPYDSPDLMPEAFECGPGKSLCAILSKINGRAAKRARAIPV